MKAFKIIGIFLLAILLFSVVWALILPSEFEISKTTYINADKEVVFNQVNDFENWVYWSPWHDTLMKIDYSGPDKGAGSKMSWVNESEGVGEMEILESVQNEYLKFDLKFRDNPNSKASAEFDFETEGDSVKVVWTFKADGFKFLVGRWVGYLIKSGVKASFDAGLKNLKNYSESLPEKPDYFGYQIKVINDDDTYYLAVKDSARADNMTEAMNTAYTKILNFAKENNIQFSGAPVSFWASFNPESYSKFICAYPVNNEVEGSGDVNLYVHKGGKKLMVQHIGPRENIANAWNALHNYTQYNNLTEIDMPYEEYLIGPNQQEDTEKWITNVYFSVD
jgi:effector-binding domain-containing protein/uncharacterized protein YndB with AHSA1/START domain